MPSNRALVRTSVAVLLAAAVVAIAEPVRVRVTVDGQARVVEAESGQSIAELVARRGIRMGPDDRVYPPSWHTVYDGLEMCVVRVRVEERDEEQRTPYPILFRDDATLAAGKVVIGSSGWCDGLARRRIRLYHRSDGVVESVVLEESVESQAMPKVFVVGTAGRPAQPPEGYGVERVMTATAYSGKQPGLNSFTALGLPAERGVVAVDPDVVPYGTKLWVEGYGFAVAGDCGGAIKGDRIDVCFDTYEEALEYGWKTVRVRFYW